MYRSILLPIDGSELSLGAARHGIAFAGALGARVTAVMVTTPWEIAFAREVAVVVPGVPVSESEYVLRTGKAASECLGAVTDAAAAAGVEAKSLHVYHRDPWSGILDAARAEGCDLIVMASHGRRGLAGLLLGSATVKVLINSEVPVLVYRCG